MEAGTVCIYVYRQRKIDIVIILHWLLQDTDTKRNELWVRRTVRQRVLVNLQGL